MKKIGIIGGKGMLGRDLVEFLDKDFQITPISKENYKKCVGLKFDVLVNANGNSKRFWANKNVIEDFSLSTVSVYNSLFDFSFKKYIYISSSDVYPNHTSPLTTKEDREISIEKLSPYGLHKYVSEMLVRRYANDFLILRSSMILGKKIKKGPVHDILQNQRLFISKNSRIQMITTTEIAKLILNLINKSVRNKIFNMGGVGTVDFNTVDKLFKKKIMFSRNAEEQKYHMNVKSLSKLFFLKTSMEYLNQYLKSIY